MKLAIATALITILTADAVAIAPAVELEPRSPCSTIRDRVPCRSGSRTSYDIVRVLGMSMVYYPTCRTIGEVVEGNR